MSGLAGVVVANFQCLTPLSGSGSKIQICHPPSVDRETRPAREVAAIQPLDRGRFSYPPESTPSPHHPHRMVSSRLVTSSRRAGRVTNKTKLLVVRGTKEADDLGEAEVVVWEDGSTSSVNNQAANGETASQHNHVGAKGVESGELLVSWTCSFFLPMHAEESG